MKIKTEIKKFVGKKNKEIEALKKALIKKNVISEAEIKNEKKK